MARSAYDGRRTELRRRHRTRTRPLADPLNRRNSAGIVSHADFALRARAEPRDLDLALTAGSLADIVESVPAAGRNLPSRAGHLSRNRVQNVRVVAGSRKRRSTAISQFQSYAEFAP